MNRTMRSLSFGRIIGIMTVSTINNSLLNTELSISFFQWLKERLLSEKLWKIDGDAKKDKNIKRCLSIENRITNVI